MVSTVLTCFGATEVNVFTLHRVPLGNNGRDPADMVSLTFGQSATSMNILAAGLTMLRHLSTRIQKDLKLACCSLLMGRNPLGEIYSRPVKHGGAVEFRWTEHDVN